MMKEYAVRSLDRLQRAQDVLVTLQPNLPMRAQRVLIAVMLAHLRGEPVTQSAICRSTGMATTEVSPAVAYLETGSHRPQSKLPTAPGGLVRSERAGRRSRVELTDLGRDILTLLLEALDGAEEAAPEAAQDAQPGCPGAARSALPVA